MKVPSLLIAVACATTSAVAQQQYMYNNQQMYGNMVGFGAGNMGGGQWNDYYPQQNNWMPQNNEDRSLDNTNYGQGYYTEQRSMNLDQFPPQQLQQYYAQQYNDGGDQSQITGQQTNVAQWNQWNQAAVNDYNNQYSQQQPQQPQQPQPQQPLAQPAPAVTPVVSRPAQQTVDTAASAPGKQVVEPMAATVEDPKPANGPASVRTTDYNNASVKDVAKEPVVKKESSNAVSFSAESTAVSSNSSGTTFGIAAGVVGCVAAVGLVAYVYKKKIAEPKTPGTPPDKFFKIEPQVEKTFFHVEAQLTPPV